MVNAIDMDEKQPKCLLLLSMIYVLILFSSAMIGNKIIKLPFLGLESFSAGSITGPLWFVLSDIIAEVYGWRISVKMFTAAMIAEFIFVCIVSFMIQLPSPDWWHYQSGYNYIMGHLFQLYFAQLLGVVIAWYLNIRLITYWQFLLRGKYFALRSIGASGIGEIIFSVISVTLSTVGLVPPSALFKIVLGSCILKIICSLLLAYPAAIVAAILKKIENIDSYSYIFNPFVNPSELQSESGLKK